MTVKWLLIPVLLLLLLAGNVNAQMVQAGSMAWYSDLVTLTAVGTTKAIVIFLILRYVLGWLLLPWADEIREFQVVMQELLKRIKKDVAQEKETEFQ